MSDTKWPKIANQTPENMLPLWEGQLRSPHADIREYAAYQLRAIARRQLKDNQRLRDGIEAFLSMVATPQHSMPGLVSVHSSDIDALRALLDPKINTCNTLEYAEKLREHYGPEFSTRELQGDPVSPLPRTAEEAIPLFTNVHIADLPPCEACGDDDVFALEVNGKWVTCCLVCKHQQDWEGPE